MSDDKQESGWLIGFGGSPPRWWVGRKWSHHDMTTNANEAIRFARKEDAERVIWWHLDGVGFATEHFWFSKGAVEKARAAPESANE